MESTAAIIVGDIYQDLCFSPHVITVSSLKLKLSQFSHERGHRKFIVGQGVDRRLDAGLIRCFADEYPTSSRLAGKPYSHKHQLKNALVTVPEEVGAGKYVSELVVDAHCAEISDHNTGCHLQGMVLAEAARQMILSVLEVHLFEESRRGSYFVVLDHLSAKFMAFAFPLPTLIQCAVENHDVDQRGNVSCGFAVNISQADECVAIFQLTVRCYEKSFMHRTELARAELAINKLVGHLSSPSVMSTEAQVFATA